MFRSIESKHSILVVTANSKHGWNVLNLQCVLETGSEACCQLHLSRSLHLLQFFIALPSLSLLYLLLLVASTHMYPLRLSPHLP